MNDTISRQAAIEALERIFNQCEEIEAHLPDGDPDKTGYKMFPDYMTVWKYLHQLQSAERHGRWVRGDEMADYPRVPYNPWETYCSCCGEIMEQSHDNFCGNCRAKMDGDVE